MQLPASKIEHKQREVLCLEFMRHHSFLSGGADTTVKHWDLRSVNCEYFSFKDHSAPVIKLAKVEASDNRGEKFMFASGSTNGEVMIW